MNLESILANPRVQEVINRIEKQYRGLDAYDFLRDICTVNTDGATKVVFLHDEWDFVIKTTSDYKKNRNYCQLEADNYVKAANYGIQRVLLETTPLCTLMNGVQLYVQPRYTSDHSNLTRNEREKIRKKLNNELCRTTIKAQDKMYDGGFISRIWFARVIQLYGKRFARSLEKWTQDNQIGDLHNSNVGWMNNRPIILDYSGYYG